MQELSHISHDTLFVGFGYVHIFSIKQFGNAQFAFGHIESCLETLTIACLLQFSQIDQICFNGINESQESDAISPTGAEILNLYTTFSVK